MVVGGRAMQLLIIRDSRHPWVISVLVGCIVSGLIGVLLPPDPRVFLDQFAPEPYRSVYYIALASAGLLTLIGIWLPRLRDRLMVELIGMWFIAAPLLIYPIALVVVLGAPVGVGGIVTCTFGIGGLVRVIGILFELRALRIGQEVVS